MKKGLIVVLIILIIGGTGFYIYKQVDSFNHKNNNQEQTETNNDINDEENNNPDDTYVEADATLVDSLMKNVTEPFDNSMVSNNYFGYLYTNDSKNIQDNVKIYIALFNLKSENYIDERLSDRIRIPSSDVKEKAIEIFGSNVTYEDQSINSEISCYPSNAIYSEGYYEYGYYCGGTKASTIKTQITSSRKYKDRIEVNEKHLYESYNYNDTEIELYKNYNLDTKKGIDLIDTLTEKREYKLENYLDKLDTYTYTFKYDDKTDKYYFDSIKLVK